MDRTHTRSRQTGIAAHKTCVALLLLLCATAVLARPSVADAPDAIAFGLFGEPASYSFDSSGVIVTIMVEKSRIQNWLPPRLAFSSDSPFPTPDHHPVLLMLSAQEGLTRHKNIAIKPLFGQRYEEASVIVPYLQLAGSSKTEHVSYHASIYLNSPTASEIGHFLFGRPTVFTPIQVEENGYRIASPDGAGILLEASYIPNSGNTFSPNDESFRHIHWMLSQPTILYRDGYYRRQSFKLFMEEDSLCGVAVDLRWNDQFIPGLPCGRRILSGVADAPYGAFRFKGKVETLLLDEQPLTFTVPPQSIHARPIVVPTIELAPLSDPLNCPILEWEQVEWE
jgi:hypothetical protein